MAKGIEMKKQEKISRKYSQEMHRMRSVPRSLKYSIIGLFVIIVVLLVSPFLLTLSIKYQQQKPPSIIGDEFPVTVDPQRKIILRNPAVEAYLSGSSSPLEANALESSRSLWGFFTRVITVIAEASWYQNMASVVGSQSKLVTITPGLRKEEVASIFAKTLSWNAKQKQDFQTAAANASLPLSEGSFLPGIYSVQNGMTPYDMQHIINQKFEDNVLARYSTSTAKIIPLNEALTIASIIQRETIGNNDMRLVSGVIWNRLFTNMNLQIDSTLQYAAANSLSSTVWWPTVVPSYKYIKSPYNTYMHPGLPPGPIANPSVGAIIAALNPIKTSCFYYFNDTHGNFHCSDTYEEHVALIKKYYGK